MAVDANCRVFRADPEPVATAAGAGAVSISRMNEAKVWAVVWSLPIEEFRSNEDVGHALSLVKGRLDALGPCASEPWLISIPPICEDGFGIELMKAGYQFRCWFDEMEVEFEEIDHALRWISRALSGEYHLRKVFIGGRAREWYLESSQEHAGDHPSLACGHVMLFSRFMKKRPVVRRNLFARGSAPPKFATSGFRQ